MNSGDPGTGGRPPRRLGESLGAVVSRLGLHDQDGVAAVFGRWEELVGPAVAAHVTPVRLDAEALVLEVDHPAWATQVRHLSGTILDRIVEAGAARPARVTVRVRSR
jgi:predicted nucleic acid-binding Zn ribbon protein